MLKTLKDKGTGFLVDEDTFYAYVAIRSEDIPFSKSEKEQLQNEIIITQKRIQGEK